MQDVLKTHLNTNTMNLRQITRGYYWSENMDFETFCDRNRFPTYSQDAEQLFDEIVIDFYFEKYENE